MSGKPRFQTPAGRIVDQDLEITDESAARCHLQTVRLSSLLGMKKTCRPLLMVLVHTKCCGKLKSLNTVLKE